MANAQYGAGPWETYQQVNNSDGTVSFQSNAFNNVFLRLDGRGMTSPQDNGGGLANGQFSAGRWEKYVICDCMTHSQANTALDQFTQWFPEEAGNINSHRQEIINACCPPYSASPQTLAALSAVQHARPAAAATAEAQAAPSGNNCAIAVGTVIYDAFSLAMMAKCYR